MIWGLRGLEIYQEVPNLDVLKDHLPCHGLGDVTNPGSVLEAIPNSTRVPVLGELRPEVRCQRLDGSTTEPIVEPEQGLLVGV
jgi:hypothetical protein